MSTFDKNELAKNEAVTPKNTFERIEEVEAKIKELSKKRYPYSIFATKNQPKFGVKLMEASKEQVLSIVKYVSDKKDKYENPITEGLAMELGLGLDVAKKDTEEFTFMDFTLEEIKEDAKMRIAQLNDEEKSAKLATALETLQNEFVTEEERKDKFMSDLDSLMS